jgi:hypothetical protein
LFRRSLNLFHAFEIISGCTAEIAHAIYFNFDSLQPKRTMIERILKSNDDKEETEIVGKILDAANSAQKQRNELSHALLMFTDEGAILHENPKRKAITKITHQYLDKLHLTASRAVVDSHRLLADLRKKRSVSQ